MITRRTAAQGAALSALSYSRILGANDRIGLGVIGTGGRGTYVMTLFQKNADLEVRALCDVYPKRIDDAQAKAPNTKTFTDHRQLLALKEVDAVLIGSPDHWHKQHACDAMEAGKDVYVEKPMCRTRDEAPVMVKTARVTGRICQVGVQQRSGPIYIQPLEKFVKTGLLGKISHIDAVWHGGVPRPMRKEPVEKPSNLDWARFLGPVAYRDWDPGQYFNFRAYLDFNGGKMTDFGHHWLDVVHMYMGERAPRSAVFAGGIHYDFKDGRTAPDTCNALFEYEGFSVLFQSNAYGNGPEYGITFYGDKGRLYVNRNRYEFVAAEKGATPATLRIPGDITSDHVRNFLDCSKSRALPNGDAAKAAISILPPLLAVQSYVEKRRLKFDPDRLEVLPL
ncbi:MAG: Gfo/Idh/MocA family oxidoreductase [Candidatus Solibacter usitatus]|nr:Gfo/Idh/MocA family oxidoreductase [Candidatus Solibacter usitatus]